MDCRVYRWSGFWCIPCQLSVISGPLWMVCWFWQVKALHLWVCLLGQHSVFHFPRWRICACCWDGSPGCSRYWGVFCVSWGTVKVQCTMQSVWWPVALLCPPPAIRRGSEPQSVALVGPFWGWGPGAVPPWLWPTRMTPQRSKDNCTAMVSISEKLLKLLQGSEGEGESGLGGCPETVQLFFYPEHFPCLYKHSNTFWGPI